MSYCGSANVSDLVGKILESVVYSNTDDDQIRFTTKNGEQWLMYHGQSCCESVCVEDICGNLSDLENSEIIMAEEVSNYDPGLDVSPFVESYTWTFYKFATKKGYVTIRWYGTSNGNYSESVNFEKVN